MLFDSRKFCEPKMMNEPGSSRPSTIPCKYENNSGTCCASSKIALWKWRLRKLVGSAWNNSRVEGSSNDRYAYVGNAFFDER